MNCKTIKKSIKNILGDRFNVDEYFAMTPQNVLEYIETKNESLIKINSFIITHKKNNPKNNIVIILTFKDDKVLASYTITKKGKRISNSVIFPVRNLPRMLKAFVMLFEGRINESSVKHLAYV